MSEVEPPVAQRRIPWHLLSIPLSLILLLAGIAVLYHRIDWRAVAEVLEPGESRRPRPQRLADRVVAPGLVRLHLRQPFP